MHYDSVIVYGVFDVHSNGFQKYRSMRAYMGTYVACVADGKYDPKDTKLQDTRPASRTKWRSRELDVWRECWLCVFIEV